MAPPSVHHAPLVDAFRQADAVALETRVFEQSDHAFSGQRIALARRLTRWLAERCADDD